MPDALTNFTTSALAAMIAETVTFPICTTKTVYQNTPSTSMRQTIASIYASGGIKAFYKGVIAAVTSQGISTAGKYMGYRWIVDLNIGISHSFRTSGKYSFIDRMLHGASAGLLTTLVTHPLDSIKIHHQMRTPFIPALRHEGMLLFYRGYSKTLSKVVVGSALFFPLYDTLQERFSNPIIASAISAVVSTLIMHPIDYLKVRHIGGLSLYTSWNPLTYYKGLTLNMARVVPHFIIIMTLIEVIGARIDVMRTRTTSSD